jgi:AcrR family transcriptional regulator
MGNGLARTTDDKEKRDRILEGSRAIFFREGVSSLTMDDIASRQGISKKTLYKYFANKQQLVAEALEQRISEIAAAVDGLARDRSRPFPERLGEILNVVARQLAQIGESLLKDMFYREPQLWERIDRFRREHVFGAVAGLFEEGIRDGYIRTDIESRLVPTIFFGVVASIMSPAQFFAMTAPPAVVFDSLVRILLGGILTSQGRRQLFSKGDKK